MPPDFKFDNIHFSLFKWFEKRELYSDHLIIYV